MRKYGKEEGRSPGPAEGCTVTEGPDPLPHGTPLRTRGSVIDPWDTCEATCISLRHQGHTCLPLLPITCQSDITCTNVMTICRPVFGSHLSRYNLPYCNKQLAHSKHYSLLYRKYYTPTSNINDFFFFLQSDININSYNFISLRNNYKHPLRID